MGVLAAGGYMCLAQGFHGFPARNHLPLAHQPDTTHVLAAPFAAAPLAALSLTPRPRPLHLAGPVQRPQGQNPSGPAMQHRRARCWARHGQCATAWQVGGAGS